MKQDPKRNNLVHPKGYQTLATNKLGNVKKFGQGSKDVILIAGLGLASEKVFNQFMKDNAQKYTMYAVTLAGYGGTQAYPMPPKGTSYEALSWFKHSQKAIVQLIDQYQMKEPAVIGFAMEGTFLGLRLAIENPDKVGEVVGIGGELVRSLKPGVTITPEQRKNFIDQRFVPLWFKTVTDETWDSNMYEYPSYSTNPARAKILAETIDAVPMRLLLRYMIEHWAYDISTELPKLKTPVLAIIPGFDSTLDDSQGFYKTTFIDTWKSAPKVITTKLIKDVGMFVHLDKPQKVNQLISSFLNIK